MKQRTIETLSSLLRFLRSYEVLEETEGCRFLLKGRDFVHFHDDPDGLWADARLSKGRVRYAVADSSGQRELMDRVAETLDALTSHASRRERRSVNRKRG